MKSFVITIMDNPESVKVADRCIKSGKKFGIDIEKFPAITPKDNPLELAKQWELPTQGFQEVYSRLENCVAAFLSHYSLWLKCKEDNEKYMILEHDAVIVNSIPLFVPFDKVMNIGKPSYGKANRPMKIGVNPLTSKRYMPGAHGYMVNPAGARHLIDKAYYDAKPTDVYMNVQNFPWLQEYYPWPVEARDTFTTIQKTEGCLAKHNYGDGYKIL